MYIKWRTWMWSCLINCWTTWKLLLEKLFSTFSSFSGAGNYERLDQLVAHTEELLACCVAMEDPQSHPSTPQSDMQLLIVSVCALVSELEQFIAYETM